MNLFYVFQPLLTCLSVWQPLKGPLQNRSLSLCDASTVDGVYDLHSRDIIILMALLKDILLRTIPNRNGAISPISFHLNTWSSLLRTLQAVVPQVWHITTTSFRDPINSLLVPHSTFSSPNFPDVAGRRQSIEYRVLVVY